MREPRVINLRNEPMGDAVYIGRASPRHGLKRSPYANPYAIGKSSRAEVLMHYAEWLERQPELIERARQELKGRTLACWCAPLRCHGDYLLRMANEEDPAA